MDHALATPRSPILGNETFDVEYHPLKWRTVLGWEKDGLVKVIRIGRKCFLLRAEIERIIAEGGRQFGNGWKRERTS
jgi:hypothetical protein